MNHGVVGRHTPHVGTPAGVSHEGNSTLAFELVAGRGKSPRTSPQQGGKQWL